MAIADKLNHTPSRITARELLVEIAGKDHVLHTVVGVLPDSPTGRIAFRCSCGTLCFASASPENVLALQNMPVEKKLPKKGGV